MIICWNSYKARKPDIKYAESIKQDCKINYTAGWNQHYNMQYAGRGRMLYSDSTESECKGA